MQPTSGDVTDHNPRSLPAVGRRHVLRGSVGVATVGLAGCLSSGGDTDEGGDGDIESGNASSVVIDMVDINGTRIATGAPAQTVDVSTVTINQGEDVTIATFPYNTATHTVETTVRLKIGPETRTRTFTLRGKQEPSEKDQQINPAQVESYLTISDITDELPAGTYDVVFTVDGTEEIIKEDALRVTPDGADSPN